MSTLRHGDVPIFLSALGSREGDPALERALAFSGGEYETEIYDDTGTEEKYLLMEDRGIDFLLNDGELSTVFLYATESDEHRIYGGAATLIDGVGFDASPDAVVRALGTPIRSTETYLTYEADSGFVQFDFDGQALKMVVVMRELIGGAAVGG